MARKEFYLHDGKKGAALAIRVTPRARRNEIVEVLSDGTVKIRLTALPEEGQSNQALVNFLSDVLNVPPRESRSLLEQQEGTSWCRSGS